MDMNMLGVVNWNSDENSDGVEVIWLANPACDFFNQKKIIRGKNHSDDLDLKFFT
jgi:hypothetical protein